MTEYQLRILIWNLFTNDNKLRTLDLTAYQVGELQNEVIKDAIALGYMNKHKSTVHAQKDFCEEHETYYCDGGKVN